MQLPRPGVLVLFATCLTAALAMAEDKPGNEAKPKEAKTSDVKIQDITLTVPESWEQQEPSNRLRLAQFVIPKAEGDTVATELVVSSFGGGGGGLEQNLPRWTGEFLADGRSLKLTSGKSKQGDYILADVGGTHIGSTFARRTKPLEDGRLLALMLTVEGKGVYYLKMTGPKKSVGAAADALRSAIGATTKDEKEYKLEKE